jgi:PhnB protein
MSTTATPSAYIGADEATVTPYLSCHDAAAAIQFYIEVFDAELVGEPFINADGTIGHSELLIGDSKIMLAGEHEPEDVRSPVSLGGTSVQLAVFVPDVDVAIERALARGATLWREARDGQYGARAGKIRDPFGHNWFIETATEGERRAPRRDRN